MSATGTATVRAGALRRIAGPVAAAAVAGLGGAAVLLIRPTDGGIIVCPWRALTGLDCPFCGATRATAALLHGDLLAALDHNAFYVLVVLPLLVAAWAIWLVSRWRDRPLPDIPNRLLQGLLVALLAWWALRLSVDWFGSGLSN